MSSLKQELEYLRNTVVNIDPTVLLPIQGTPVSISKGPSCLLVTQSPLSFVASINVLFCLGIRSILQQVFGYPILCTPYLGCIGSWDYWQIWNAINNLSAYFVVGKVFIWVRAIIIRLLHRLEALRHILKMSDTSARICGCEYVLFLSGND